MKVLFLAWQCYPYKSATANCVRSIIEKMHEKGIEVGLINLAGEKNDKQITTQNVQIYNVFDPVCANIGSLIKNKDFLNLIKSFICKFVFNVEKKVFSGIYSSQSVKRIKKALIKYACDYDLLIPVCSHVQTAVACIQYCKTHNKKYVLYQVDPIGTNKAYSNSGYMQKLEKEIYNNASAVITTPVLLDEKKNDADYDLSKVIPMEFPNVRDLTGKQTDNGKIICFYSGRFYSGVRDCNFALKVLSNVQNKDVQIVFAGSGQEDVIQQYSNGSLLNRLTHIGEVSLDKSFSLMQEANVLLNIGNNVVNQVPSKIFDYISTGKPVINFCKFENCPTIPYFEKYGNAINIIQGKQTIEIQAQMVDEFIKNNINKAMTYDEIKTNFYENTADYVGQEFVNVINEIKL